MLVTTNAAVWYGPAIGSSTVGGDGSVTGQSKGSIRTSGLVGGDGFIPFARPTRLIDAPVSITGVGSVPFAQSKGTLRSGALVGITEISQAEITGAVLEAEIYPGLSLKKALRGIVSAQFGKVGIAGNVVAIRNPSDTKDAITAVTDTEGRRTAVTLDLE